MFIWEYGIILVVSSEVGTVRILGGRMCLHFKVGNVMEWGIETEIDGDDTP